MSEELQASTMAHFRPKIGCDGSAAILFRFKEIFLFFVCLAIIIICILYVVVLNFSKFA